MNIDLKTLPDKIIPVMHKLNKYLAVILIVGFVSIYSYLMLRINTLTASKPTEDAVVEKLKTVQRPRIDETAAEKMQQLEDQNIPVQTLFNEARQNPFNE